MIGEWVREVQEMAIEEEKEQEELRKASDDVKGVEILFGKVKAARNEEVGYMHGRNI